MIRFHSSAMRLAALLLLPILTATPSGGHESHGEGDAAQAMLIAAITPNGPAARAGLLEGDRILAWDGEALRTQDDLDAFLARREPGDTVALEIDRRGGTLRLELNLGDRGDGRPRLGLSLGVESSAPPSASDMVTRDECRAWITETFRVAELGEEFGLDLTDRLTENRACVDRDLSMMPASIPRGWCNNVFKVHCSGLDLLAEIGDEVVDRCGAWLSDTFSFDVGRNRTWNTCGEQHVFDAYSIEGRVTDTTECRRIYVEECGGEISAPGDR
jgi:hypothetical protein